MKNEVKKFAPHAVVVALFIGLTIAYMAPIVFENKNIYQGDVISGSAWGKDLSDYHKQTGEYAFWSNSMFSGMPANYTFMPPMPNLFHYIHRAIHSVLPGNLSLIFLYLIGFYIFLLSIGCKPWLSAVGAIAYTFASYNIVIISAGHVNKALVMATMAPIIGGVILTYRKKYLWGIITTLIFTGLNVYWAHQQISYYLLIILLTLAVVYLIYAFKEKTVKEYFISSALLIVVAVFAVAPELGTLISQADYTKETMRGGAVLQTNVDGKKESSGLDIDYAFQWSYGKGETMTLLIPNFYGASSHYNIGTESESYKVIQRAYGAPQATQFSKYAPMYWGAQMGGTSGPVYMGAIVCFLFVLGLMIIKGKEKWWMLVVTVIAIVMSWGKNFEFVNNYLFYHLPLYNKFRVPAMILVIPGVTMAALGILAFKEIIENREKRNVYLKPLYIAAGITGGLCLVFALFGGSLMSFSTLADANYQEFPELLNAIIADRRSMFTADAWRSFFLIAAAAGALWYYLQKSLKMNYVIAIVGALIFIDLWMVDKRFVNDDSFVPVKQTREFTATPANEMILRDTDPNYRVFNLTSSPFQESATSAFHKSIGGYSPAKLRRYQDIIDYYFSKELNWNILHMLNTRYIIFTADQKPQVQMNPEAMGNVWFVNEIQWVDSPDEEIVMLQELNLAQTAVIDKVWQEKIPDWEKLQHETVDRTAHIHLTDYANPGYLIYESSAELPHLAVFSEVYYKTWRAYINGVEAPLVRVNYILRGLEIPPGNHTIELKCIDELFQQGAKISLIASIITGIVLCSLFGYAIWRAIRLRP